MSGIEVRRVTESAWSDIEQLFGRGGASNGCWCQYWLLGADYHRRVRAENRRALAAQVRAGQAGLLAYRDGAAVGWARFTPRSELAYLTTRFASYDFGDGDPWSLSCFFVASQARGDGVMRTLVDFAAQWGRDQHTAVEGYPIDPAIAGATQNRFPGVLPTFLAAGFVEDGRLAKDRAVVKSVVR
ncbi:MAG: GNAT family N-acetyltransferase [Actinomycetota bacterium]|nr:GNAT family N-acetyltransferase [Actinomycetota bacterium]